MIVLFDLFVCVDLWYMLFCVVYVYLFGYLGYFIVCDSFVFALFECLFVSFGLVRWFEGLFWFVVIVLFELYFTLCYDCLISYWWCFIWFCLLFFGVCLWFEFWWFWVFDCLGWFYLRATAFACGLIVFVVGFIFRLVVGYWVNCWCFCCSGVVICVWFVFVWYCAMVWLRFGGLVGWLYFVVWLSCWFWGSWWYFGVIVLIWFSFYFLLFGLIWIVIVVWLCYFVWLVWLVGRLRCLCLVGVN